MSTAREISSEPSDSTPLDPSELIRRYQVGIWRYLRALGCESAEAEDLTQDTFVAVLEKPFEQYNEAATVAYLRRVAFNRFISTRRRNGKVVADEHVEELDRTWTRLVSDDHGEAMLDALRECLEHLTKRAKWALEMRFRDRLSRAEIASSLNITEHGAKNLMQRAKKQLRSCVEGKLT